MSEEPKDNKNNESLASEIAEAIVMEAAPELIDVAIAGVKGAISAGTSAAEDALEKTEEVVSAVGQKLGDLAGSAGETLGDVGEAAADAASNIDISS